MWGLSGSVWPRQIVDRYITNQYCIGEVQVQDSGNIKCEVQHFKTHNSASHYAKCTTDKDYRMQIYVQHNKL